MWTTHNYQCSSIIIKSIPNVPFIHKRHAPLSFIHLKYLMSNAFYIFLLWLFVVGNGSTSPKMSYRGDKFASKSIIRKSFSAPIPTSEKWKWNAADVKHALTLPKADNTSYTIKHAQYRANWISIDFKYKVNIQISCWQNPSDDCCCWFSVCIYISVYVSIRILMVLTIKWNENSNQPTNIDSLGIAVHLKCETYVKCDSSLSSWWNVLFKMEVSHLTSIINQLNLF